jgi:hypothetical protein
MTDPIIEKDFYKFDVYRFDIDQDGDSYYVDIGNVISWDIMTLKATKEELLGLADFINKYLGQK